MIDETARVFVCDGRCGAHLDIDPSLPPGQQKQLLFPWREFEVPGWVGLFHACSDLCEQRVRRLSEL